MAPQLEPGTGMGVIIQRGMFGEDNGQIQWFGIIATTNSSCECRALEGSRGLEGAPSTESGSQKI